MNLGGSLGAVVRAVEQGEHDTADELTRGMEALNHAGAAQARQLVTLARRIGNRLPGGMRLGDRAFGKGSPRHPSPAQLPVNTRNPSKSYCSNLAGGKPFPLVGRLVISAGAQTQGTDLGDFHSTTANPTIITTSDLIPGNVAVKSCRLTIGVKMITTLGADTQAVLEDLWVIERVNGTEIARWSPADLGCSINHSGVLGTAFGVVGYTEISGKWQEWDRTYDPNVPYALAVQIGRTYTTIQDLDLTFTEAGQRP